MARPPGVSQRIYQAMLATAGSISKGDPGTPGTLIYRGSSIVDFGDTPSAEASVDVTGQTGITPGARVRAYIEPDVMGSNNAADHLAAAECIKVITGIPIQDIGFTVYLKATIALWTKRFRVQWSWHN